MHQHSKKKKIDAGGDTALLVGNPNVGKSVIFNQLTGHYAVVSNYPGTTIEVTSAEMSLGLGNKITLVDTPGVNGLLPYSEDERVTQRILLERDPLFIIQVADAKNLSRTLQLTFQLLDLRIPMVLALNMSDEADQIGLHIDTEALSKETGIDVVMTSAPEGKGIGQLRRLAAKAKVGRETAVYNRPVEEAIRTISGLLDKHPRMARFLAVMLLGRDPYIVRRLAEHYASDTLDEIEKMVVETERKFQKPLSLVMATSREKAASEIFRKVSEVPDGPATTLAGKIGVWARAPLTGIPLLLVVVFLLYWIVGRFAAGTLVDFMEETVFGQLINPWVERLVNLVPWPIFREMMMGNFGLISMGLTYSIAIVLPIVGTFFFCFGFLEDSGYLPRLSIMSNRIFRRIGLNGKAILPMVLGLGCDTMATLTARILETKKERLIVTLLLALGIPCSAQLGVMLAIMASLNPWAVLTVVGVILSQLLLVGYLASRLLPGEGSDFIMEIPPIRLPRVSNLFLKTYLRVEWFLKEAIPLFLLGALILFLADKLGVLRVLIRMGSPVVVHWLQLPADTTTIFIMGFFRRDYGAAGLYQMSQMGLITARQMVVSLVVITLFVPCIANFLVIIKEQGPKKALSIAAFVFPFAILVGGVLNLILNLLHITF